MAMLFNMKNGICFFKKTSIFAEILNLSFVLFFKMLWMQDSSKRSNYSINWNKTKGEGKA